MDSAQMVSYTDGKSEPAELKSNILYLLREFKSELPATLLPALQNATSMTQPLNLPYTETEWLNHLEFTFVLRALRMELLRSLGRSIGAIGSDFQHPTTPASSASSVKQALLIVEGLIDTIEATEHSRLAVTEEKNHPLVLKLARRYGLSVAEADLFQLLFVRGASKAASIRAAIGGNARQDDKEMAMDLCGMSVLEVEEFLDDKRTHISEGIIVAQDDYDGKTFRMIREAVSALLLKPMKTEQWLKLSKTELLNALEGREHKDVGDVTNIKTDTLGSQDNDGIEKRKRKRSSPEIDDDILAHVGRIIQPDRGKQRRTISLLKASGGVETDTTLLETVASSETCTPGPTTYSDPSKGELRPYLSSLEYLDDAFQVLALMVRIAKARHKEDMKEAFNDERSWYDSYRSTKVSSVRELQAKLRFVKNKLQERMRLTEEGVKTGTTKLPRLEALVRKLGLDEFEKGVVLMLTGVSISPVVKSIFEGENGDSGFRRSTDHVQVQDILTVYFNSFKEQVLARTYFYKSSKLVSRGLIKMRTSVYTRGKGDLMDQQVELDRRMLDWIVGLDTEMNELVEGSYLYQPKVSMEQVVLPEEQKNVLLRTVDNFGKFREYKKSEGLEDVLSSASGLVILLCGPSGTGKTMTVNALAHHLGKRVLSVDFHLLYSGSSGFGREDDSADIRGLFRDAEMNDAVIFFDECEAIFAQRERGGDKTLNTLLTEMERHEGIIMLATNRPQDLDEAMHRRITCVSDFHPPDHRQRQAIWKISAEKLPVAVEIEWEKIALRYELTGGYIKNALVSALLSAISRDNRKPLITEADIVEGCRLQMRGSLQMKTFTHRVIPKVGMDELVLSSAMRERLDAVLKFEKARSVLLGQWGFQQERLGTACLFWGPHGTGKSAAAEALGYELGRPLKVVNCGQLLSRESSSKTSSNINTAFKDARLMDAVLVLEDFQVIGSEDELGAGNLTSVSAWSHVAIGLLLHELQRFPGICILVANVAEGSTIVRLDRELVRRLKFVVEFKMPDQSVRASMWKKMIPTKTPLASDVDFEELARRFDFNSGAISSATVRAAAMAALRTGDASMIKQKDLVEAAEYERIHLRDEMHELMLRAFI